MSSSVAQPGYLSFAREQKLVALLMTFIATGLFCMVLPGTFLGVWNLFEISAHHQPTSISTAWVQAHGHAQLFGWIGSFILGIGFYSIPKVRQVASNSYWEGWLAWALWAAGVSLRWYCNIYLTDWRFLLPLSGFMECVAVVIFFAKSYQGHRSEGSIKKRLEPWSISVIAGTTGLLLSVILNLAESIRLGIAATTPAFPPEFDSRYLVLCVWGFVVPVAWGFSARWFPTFLGLKPLDSRLFLIGLIVNLLGVVLALGGFSLLGALALAAGGALVVVALHVFERSQTPPKTTGVHSSFPIFVRIAYGWLIVAALLTVWSTLSANAAGIGGAGRHAITVGFMATLVFCIGPRILPAFLGRKGLFSSALMLISLVVLCLGCALRVGSEVLAYQEYLASAWNLLPISATFELIAVLVFAVNMIATLLQPPLLTPSKS